MALADNKPFMDSKFNKEVLSWSDEILDVIDHADEYTRGDLQGVIEAIVMKIIRETKAA